MEALYTDPRYKQIKWNDLKKITPCVLRQELTVPLFFIGVLITSIVMEYWIIALMVFPFVMFNMQRIAHELYHNNLFESKKNNDVALYIVSLFMTVSGHAAKFNHQIHHKALMHKDDMEGDMAKMTPWKTILFSPLFIGALLFKALTKGNQNTHNWVVRELISIGFIYGILIFLFPLQAGVYFGLMFGGQLMSGFLGVWLTHHHTDGAVHPGRTYRNRILIRITFNMFYHAEHHMFPKVPVSNLPEIAKRIDAVMPEIKEKGIL